MSYCRFGEADVYIYASVSGGIECSMCSISPEDQFSFNSPTEEGMLEHIAAHRAAGHFVPKDVDDQLLKEIAERDSGDTCEAFVPFSEREESVIFKNIGLPIDDEIAPIPTYITTLSKAVQHLKERQQYIPETKSEDFRKGYVHALRELEFYNEVSRVLPKHGHGDEEV
jgi:hypothetical protein